MRKMHKSFITVCCLCLALALSTCTYELCLAQDTDQETPPDSLPGNIEPRFDEESERIWVNKAVVLDTPADSLETESEPTIRNLHRKWWVWALATTAIAVTAVLLGGGEEKKTEEDLPGFPEPPSR